VWQSRRWVEQCSVRASSRAARDREDSPQSLPRDPYWRPVGGARGTVFVRASIASTLPTGVGGVTTFQDVPAPRAFDSRQSTRAAAEIGRDLLNHLPHAVATGSSRLFPNPLLEASDSLGSNPPPWFSFTREAESEEFPLPRSGHGALRLRLAMTSPPSGCQRDFHPRAVEHARRTQERVANGDPPGKTASLRLQGGFDFETPGFE